MNPRSFLAWLIFAAAVWAPAAPLAWDALSLTSEARAAALQTMASRWPVLLATIALAAAAGALSALLGGLAALASYGRSPAWGRSLVPLAAAAAVVPAYLHALAWMPALSPAGGRIHGAGAWLASGWVLLCSSLPLCFLFATVQRHALAPGLLQAATLWAESGRAIRQVALPLMRPALAAAAALVYLNALTDFAMPSLFSADPWALAVFSEFSATHDSGLAALHSLPAVLAGVPAVLLLVRWLRGLTPRSRHADEGTAQPFRLNPWLAAGALALALSLGWLAASLLSQAATGTTAHASLHAAETARSILWAALGAALALAAGAPVGHLLASSPRISPWLAVALPLAFPAPLAGIGLIRIWNQPWGELLYGTPWMIALAAAARFAPVAALLAAACRISLDPRPLQAASLYAPSAPALLALRARIFAPAWAAAAALCFALALTEVPATLPVMPPGGSTLALRLYNYLHYGASGSVALTALVLASAAAVAGLALARFARRRQP